MLLVSASTKHFTNKMKGQQELQVLMSKVYTPANYLSKDLKVITGIEAKQTNSTYKSCLKTILR